MLKSIALGALLATGFLGYSVADNTSNTNVSATNETEDVKSDTVQVSDDTTIELDVFYMYSNGDGTYWLDPTADYENVVFIGYDALEEWNIDFDELHHGNQYLGTFDETGWELLDLK